MATSTAVAGERQPLLRPARSPPPPSPSPSHDSDDSDDDSPEPEPASPRRRLLRFVLLWSAVSTLTIYLIVQAFRKGGGEFDWKGALKKAGGGGLAGAMAMVIQVLTLMPLRTVMKCAFSSLDSPQEELTNLSFVLLHSYQYRFGTTTTEASRKLYEEGGWGRYYAGLAPALVQGPVGSSASSRGFANSNSRLILCRTARFGDTASNAGILALLSSNPFLSRLPSPLKTAFASLVGALFRMVLMPVDTLKTTMQAQGSSNALQILKERVKTYGPGTLWAGAWATAAANFVGSWPWFATYNALSAYLPPAPPADIWAKLGRQAFIGFVSSVVSDTCSNSLRVIKTYRQVSRKKVGYRASGFPSLPQSALTLTSPSHSRSTGKAAQRIMRTEGARGLFGRGLKTRILANGLQGLLFSVLWKAFAELIEGKGKKGGDV